MLSTLVSHDMCWIMKLNLTVCVFSYEISLTLVSKWCYYFITQMQMGLTDSQIQDDSRSVSDDMVGTSPQMPHVALLHNSDGETSVRSQHSIDTESVSSEDSVMVIPSMWRPSILSCIKEKKLTLEARNEIVRDLCTHMYGHMKSEVEKPTAMFCREVAQKLVKKYPFMADSGGLLACVSSA